MLDPRLFYMTHLFVHAWNAPPETVGAIVLREADEVHASCIVVASNDQVRLHGRPLQALSRHVQHASVWL